jgi:hypothetical protein
MRTGSGGAGRHALVARLFSDYLSVAFGLMSWHRMHLAICRRPGNPASSSSDDFGPLTGGYESTIPNGRRCLGSLQWLALPDEAVR